jgi:hypothetical protein
MSDGDRCCVSLEEIVQAILTGATSRITRQSERLSIVFVSVAIHQLNAVD